MKRREFITLLGGAAAVWPLAVRAQQAGRNHRIGFLGMTSYAQYRHQVDALRAGLRQLGYEEGRGILQSSIDGPRTDTTAFPELATELVRMNVNIIVTHSTPGAKAAKEATSTIPIVAISGDPVAFGLVASLHSPGGISPAWPFSSLRSAPSG